MTHPTSDQLQQAFTQLSERARPRDDCPEPDQLWRARTGQLSPRATRRIVKHTVECGVCAESWRLAAELEAGRERPMGRVIPFPVPLWTVAAAVLLLGILVPIFGPHLWRPVTSIDRGEDLERIESELAAQEGLSRADFHLRWNLEPAQKNLIRYELHVTTEDLFHVLVHETDLVEPEFKVPENLLGSLPEGAAVTWRVTAVFEDGSRTSRVFVTRVQ
ncbi:hypothetical protein SCOR_10980 [Sulfidibacter corallicola]|uniref:Zinc-finger domain-containing protein n=1 Tax=Sulfidibacter corallicola TaxID=2818388 RepID=A0A8A4TF24_SULCO|nr:hypothetical protein [Sulfidibacter corallicola]QTD48140.1 hypothetical protein J3U87_21350 [Sulfidibacter corallicola]